MYFLTKQIPQMKNPTQSNTLYKTELLVDRLSWIQKVLMDQNEQRIRIFRLIFAVLFSY